MSTEDRYAEMRRTFRLETYVWFWSARVVLMLFFPLGRLARTRRRDRVPMNLMPGQVGEELRQKSEEGTR